MSTYTRTSLIYTRDATAISGQVAFEGDVAIPDANKFTILLDTTLSEEPSNASVYRNAKVAALPAARDAGDPNESHVCKLYFVAVKCTGADVQLYLRKCDPFLVWEDVESVAGDSPITIVAGAGTTVFSIDGRGTSGVMVAIGAGAIPPTTLGVTITEEVEVL